MNLCKPTSESTREDTKSRTFNLIQPRWTIHKTQVSKFWPRTGTQPNSRGDWWSRTESYYTESQEVTFNPRPTTISVRDLRLVAQCTTHWGLNSVPAPYLLSDLIKIIVLYLHLFNCKKVAVADFTQRIC